MTTTATTTASLTVAREAVAYAAARGSRQTDLVGQLLDTDGMPSHIPTAMGISRTQQRQPGRVTSAQASWDGLAARLVTAGFATVELPSGPRGGRRLHLVDGVVAQFVTDGMTYADAVEAVELVAV